MRKALCIIGMGNTGRAGVAWMGRNVGAECWTMNGGWKLPRVWAVVSGVFDLHTLGRGYEPDIAGLNGLDCRVWLQKHDKRIPRSDGYPYGDVVRAFPQIRFFAGVGAEKPSRIDFNRPESEIGYAGYFTSSLAYMLAYAIYLECYEEIVLFGVDYNAQFREEAHYERPCTEFWLGVAMGRGMKVTTHQASTLFTFAPCVRMEYGRECDYREVDLKTFALPKEDIGLWEHPELWKEQEQCQKQ